MYVRINDNVLTDLVMQNGATTTGNGVAMPVAGRAGMVMQVSGTFEATVVFEATQDEVNWIAILGQNMNTGGQVTSTTAPGLFAFAVNGLKSVRARISAIASGAVTVKGTMSPMPLAGLSSSVINATVDAVKIKDVTGTNTLGVEADGSALMKLTSSSVQEPGVLTSQAKKDIVMKVYDNIINIIESEATTSVREIFPLSETSGSEFSGLLNPSLKLVNYGATLNQPGLLHQSPTLDGVAAYIVQKSVTENRTGSSEQSLSNSAYKLAQKLVSNVGEKIGYCELYLKKVGAPVVSLVVDICVDASGVPGTVVATSEAVSESKINTSARWVGFSFSTLPNIRSNQVYWLVLRVSSATTLDASNYIVWLYDSAGNYGQPRAVYDGTTWTVTTGQSHMFVLGHGRLAFNNASFSYIMPLKCTSYTSAFGLLLLPGDSGFTIYLYDYGMTVGLFDPNLADTIFNPVIPETDFSIYTYTFSYPDSTDKIKVYRNNVLVGKRNGTANTGIVQQKAIVTHNVYYTKGTIGPLIFCDGVLTAKQVAKITDQLLSLRARGLVT